GRKIRPRSSPSALFPLPGDLRCVPHRVPAGSRRRSGCRHLGFAPSSLSMARSRYSSSRFFRALRRPHLHLRLPFSLHIFFLVRGPHRHPSALLESAGLRPLSALHLLRLHPIPAELDHSVRLRHLLSRFASPRPPRISHLRAAHPSRCRGDIRARRHLLAHRPPPLFVYRIITSKKKKAGSRRPISRVLSAVARQSRLSYCVSFGASSACRPDSHSWLRRRTVSRKRTASAAIVSRRCGAPCGKRPSPFRRISERRSS